MSQGKSLIFRQHDCEGQNCIKFVLKTDPRVIPKQNLCIYSLFSGVYGIQFPLGTLDIYVNGGRAPQPDCLYDFGVNSFSDLLEKCKHNFYLKKMFCNIW